MWQHLCVCVCVFVSLVGLSARASSQALSYSSDSDSYNCSWATDRARERRMGERGTVVDPQVLTLAPKCFWIKYIYKSDKIATSNTKKTSSESCEMHLLFKLISTLGLSWVSAQHEMPEFVGGCASAFNQLQICKYLLNWLTLSVERFSCSIWKRFLHTQRCSEAETRNHLQFFYNLDQKNHKNFEALNNGKPQLFGNDWQSHSVSLSLSPPLSVPLPLCLSIQLMRKTCLLSSNKCNRLSYIIYIYE